MAPRHPELKLPRWRRGDLTDRLDNHMDAESIYERDVAGVLQVLERTMLKDRPTQDCRPFYRLVEVKDGKARQIKTIEVRATWTLRELRVAADRRATRILRRAAERTERVPAGIDR